MAEDASGVFAHLREALVQLLDRTEHDALSPTQLKIFETQPGEHFCLFCGGSNALFRGFGPGLLVAVLLLAGQIALQVDIDALTIPVGGLDASGPPRASAPRQKAAAPPQRVFSQRSVTTAMPNGVSKAGAKAKAGGSEKKDPAQLKHERQLAEEAEVHGWTQEDFGHADLIYWL
jgi:hypothetical protein